MPINHEVQSKILNDIRAMVPDHTKNRNDRRHQLVLGAVLALQAVDHELVPCPWLMLALSGRTEELFRPPAKPAAIQQAPVPKPLNLCTTCKGTGRLRVLDKEQVCYNCRGTGQERGKAFNKDIDDF